MGRGAVVQSGEKRSAQIEALRALAALGVLAWHVLYRADSLPPLGVVTRLAYAGQHGVYLFFALTGYLLFLPFARHIFAAGPRVNLAGYARNRALRILPLYYVVLATLLVISHGGGSAEQWWRFGTLTQSFYADTVINDVDGPMWSLAVEVQFYILLPLFGSALAAAPWRSARAAAATIVALGLVSASVWWLKVHQAGAPDFRWNFSFPATAFHFAPGMLLALARVRLEQQPLRLPPSSALFVGGVALWVVAAYSVSVAPLIVAQASFLLLGAVVLPTQRAGLVRLLEFRPLVLVGVASYSLYLWHYPIVVSLGRHTDLGFFGLLLLALAVCLPIALLSYAVVERTFLRLRRPWGATAAEPPRDGPHRAPPPVVEPDTAG
jgi:peptidoglycan/LPS O-acetylase OafA/YrhL